MILPIESLGWMDKMVIPQRENQMSPENQWLEVQMYFPIET